MSSPLEHPLRLDDAIVGGPVRWRASLRLLRGNVGSGENALLAAKLAAKPVLCGILFDQHHAVATAGALLERASVADRCEVVSGSFFGAVPGGADAYLLKSIVYDWYAAAAVEILRACRAAIADTGRLLVVEPLSGRKMSSTRRSFRT